jgi:hypothetical protein
MPGEDEQRAVCAFPHRSRPRRRLGGSGAARDMNRRILELTDGVDGTHPGRSRGQCRFETRGATWTPVR